MTEERNTVLNEWQPIETAPKDGARVLLLLPYEPSIFTYGECIDVGFWEDSWFRFTGDDGPDDIQPTHWMPLPAPPNV